MDNTIKVWHKNKKRYLKEHEYVLAMSADTDDIAVYQAYCEAGPFWWSRPDDHIVVSRVGKQRYPVRIHGSAGGRFQQLADGRNNIRGNGVLKRNDLDVLVVVNFIISAWLYAMN